MIKINQVWESETGRTIRILAHHPDGGWIYKLQYTKHPEIQTGTLHVIGNVGLEAAYALKYDVCDHRGYRKGEIEIDGHMYYKCPNCDDIFPVIGDDYLWFPVELYND